MNMRKALVQLTRDHLRGAALFAMRRHERKIRVIGQQVEELKRELYAHKAAIPYDSRPRP